MTLTQEILRTAILATIDDLGYIDLASDAEEDRDFPVVIATLAKHLGLSSEEQTDGPD